MTAKAMVIVALAAHVASAETWYWSPKTKTGDYYYWNNANNWTNTAATRGFPQAGDTAVLGWGSASSQAYQVCDGNDAYALHEVRFEGNKTISMNQGAIVLQGGGGGLQYLRNADSVGNYMPTRLVGDGEIPINIKYNRNYAHQRQLTVSGSPTLVKTGPGKFICFNEAGARAYTVPLTLVRQGAIDITTTTALDGVTFAFDGDDESQRICYCYRATDALDLVWKNIGFYETNGVANAAHGFSARNDNQVKFTGTPKQNPTVFSGTFYDKAGLNWAPASADYTFICSNAVSATQGSMIVTKGTVRLVTGASFTALGTLNVAAGAVFEVEEGSGANFHADALTLADATAQLKLGAGVALEMGAGTLNGNALPRGTYSADGADGTRMAAWIDGAGMVTVVSGPDNVDTWSGAGADALTSTDANWASGTVPDMMAGDLLATFATGGTEAALPAGTAAAFDGLVLDAANLGGTAFSFTAGAGATAAVGASGITVAPASTATTWTMGWPITVTGGAQTWTVGAGNTLKIGAPWGGTQDLVFTGAGATELNTASTHSGSLLLDQGTFRVTADNALGAASRTVQYHFNTASLVFAGDVTNAAPIDGTWGVSGSQDGGLKIADGANAVFTGKATFYNAAWVDVGAGATATFANGFQVNVNGMNCHLQLKGSGTVVITNSPISLTMQAYSASGQTTTLDLRVPNNRLCGRYWAEFPAATVRTRAANAFHTGTSLYLGAKGTLDLCGTPQQLNRLHGAAGAVARSDAPATLTLLGGSTIVDAGDLHGNDATRVDNTSFSGQVSVTKQGSVQHTLGGVSSSTGTLTVAEGTLTLSGAWPNCTNVVVSGGTFAVKNANAFGDADRAPGESPKLELDVAASGATLNLDYAGQIDCQAIRVDGVKRYGVFGAAGSGAANEAEWITGTGTVRALPRTGTVISVR